MLSSLRVRRGAALFLTLLFLAATTTFASLPFGGITSTAGIAAFAAAPSEDIKSAGSLTAAWNGTGTAPAGSNLRINAPASSVLSIGISGTFVATAQFEGTIDGTNWFAITGTPITGGATVTSATAAGQWNFQYAGLLQARVRVSAYTSGTLVVTMRATSAAPSPSGSATTVSGTVTANAGTGTFTTAGGLTNNNAAPGANNMGTLPALANAAVPTWVEGNQVLLSTNLTGALRCIVSGTTVPGSAVPLPVAVGMNGAGAVLKHMTSALGAYPTPGDQALAVGPGVFDGANWQSQRGNTSGVFTQGPAAAGAAIAGNPLLAGGSDGTNARALKTDSSGNLQVGNVAGTAAIGNVGGLTKTVSSTLTRPANTTTYTANDEMTDTGTTIRTITGAATASGGKGIITHCFLSCSSNGTTKPTFTVYVYDTTSTPQTDNAAFAPADGVQDTCIGYFTLSSSEVGDATAGTGNFTMDSGQIHIPFTTVGSADLYFRVKVTNGYTPGANSDTNVFRFKIQQDSN